MPAELVFILCIVHAGIRRDGEVADADSMTAGQMLMALRLARDVERLQVERGAVEAPLQPAADENVTPLSSARGKKE
jgi:hypothetical protein